jgi:photosystem II stability/assembly factor-like uncharacterized protein
MIRRTIPSPEAAAMSVDRRLVPRAVLPTLLAALSAAAAVRPAPAAWRSEGPELGAVVDLAVDPAAPETVYAATSHGGVFRSDDFGRHWRPTGGDIVGWPLEWIEVDRAAPATLWVGVDTPGEPALWRSLDRGASWERVVDRVSRGELGNLHPTGVRIAFAPSRSGDIWVPSTNLHYRSRDGGKTWSDFRVPGQDAYAIAVDPSEPDVVWAGGSGDSYHLSRTDDGGRSWRPVGRGLERNGVKAIVADPERPGTVYVATGFSRLYKSTDRGESFVELPSPAGATADLYRIVLEPRGSGALWLATESGLFRSGDGGESWSDADDGTGRYLVRSVAFDPRDPRRMLAAMAGGGVYRSEDGGGSWSPSSSGLAAGWADGLWAAPGSATVFAQVSGLQRRDAGGSWSELGAPFRDDGDEVEPDGILFERGAPRSVWLFSGSSAWRSSDGGTGWRALERREPSMREMLKGSLESEQFRSLAQDSGDAKVFYAGAWSNDEPGKAIFKSTDGGRTWKPSGEGVPNETVKRLSAGGPGVVLALVDGHGLMRTLDGGRSWSAAGAGLPEEEVRELVADPAAPARLYAATEVGLFRSTDDGASFRKIGGALDEEDVESVVVAPDGRAYAGTFHGVFASRDGGETWTPVNDGLPHTDVRALAIGGDPVRLWAGTAGGGVWSTELP